MKSTRISIIVTLFLLFSVVGGWAYYTSDSITASRVPDRIQASVGQEIVISSSFINGGSTTLKGFYYSENIPEALTVTTQSVAIDGSVISNYVLDVGAAGDVYPGTVIYRWVLETPTAFTENNLIPPSSTAQIVFSVSAAQAGTYPLNEFSWVGYYSSTVRGTFGYSDAADQIQVEFVSTGNSPTADDKLLTIDEDTSGAVTLTGSDADGDSLTFEVVSGPSHGTLSGTSPDLVYMPGVNYHGADSFTYRAFDGALNSAPATVDITVLPVNDSPVADAMVLSVNEDTTAPLTLTGSDADGDFLTFEIVTGPSHGVLSGTSPDLVYTPGVNYNGSDSFTCRAYDGALYSALATVDITVASMPDTPVADDKALNVNEDTTAPVTLTGSDVDGDSLTFEVVSGPSHGTLSGTAPDLMYTPDTDYHGADSFTYRASDGALYSASAIVDITVTPVNDPPVIQGTPASAITSGSNYSFTPLTTDVDSTGLSFTIKNKPQWAMFDTNTGTLSGVPGYAGAGTTYPGISISVSDGEFMDTLPSFDITVLLTANRENIAFMIKDMKAALATEQEVKDLVNDYMEP